MGSQVYDEKYPITNVAVLNPASGTTEHDQIPLTYCPYRVDSLSIQNTDTIDHVIVFSLTEGASSYPVLVGTVLAGAGNGTVPLYEPVATLAPAIVAGLIVIGPNKLTVRVPVALNTGKIITIVATGGLL